MDNLKAVCFDMGDTVAEMSPSIHDCGHSMFQDFGLSCTAGDAHDALTRAWMALGDEYMAVGGALSAEFWNCLNMRWLEELGAAQDSEHLVDLMRERFFSVDWQGSLLDEVPDLLVALRARGYRLGIISN